MWAIPGLCWGREHSCAILSQVCKLIGKETLRQLISELFLSCCFKKSYHQPSSYQLPPSNDGSFLLRGAVKINNFRGNLSSLFSSGCARYCAEPFSWQPLPSLFRHQQLKRNETMVNTRPEESLWPVWYIKVAQKENGVLLCFILFHVWRRPTVLLDSLIAEYPQPLFYCPGSGVISLTQTWAWVCTHKSRSCLDLQCLHPPPLSVPLSACAFGGRAPRADHMSLLETKPAVLAAFCTALSVLLCCFSGSHFPVGVVPPRTKSPTPESSTIASYVTLRKNKKIDLRTVLQNNLWSLVATPKVRVIFILLTKKIIVLKAWYTRLVEIAIERMIKL